MAAEKNTNQHKTWLIVAHEDESFHRTYGYMKNHEKGPNSIAITFDGEGKYLLDAANSIRDEDWFPASDGLANQVEEVRIVCNMNLRRQQKTAPKTVFPLRIEALQGRKVRIEIPCENSIDATRDKMHLARGLLLKLHRSPNNILAAFDVVIASCKNDDKHPKCLDAKTKIGQLLSSELMKPLKGAAAVCGVNVNAGLSEKKSTIDRPAIPAKPTFAELYSQLDLESELEGEEADLRQTEIYRFFEQALPHCGGHSMKEILGYEAKRPEDFQVCLDEIRTLREFLNKKGVDFRKDGSVSVKAMFARDLKSWTEKAIEAEARGRMEDNPNIVFTEDQWKGAYRILGGAEAFAVQQKIGNQLYAYGTSPVGDCDVDIECAMPLFELKARITSEVGEKTWGSAAEVKAGVCYKVTTRLLPAGKVEPVFTPFPAGCKN